MYLQKYAPSPALRSWVRSIQVFELETGSVPMFVPAWARFSLVFQYGDLFSFQRRDGQIVPTTLAGVTGPLTEPLRLAGESPVSIKMIGVHLQPMAAFELFGEAAGEVINRATSMADLRPRVETGRVTEALHETEGDLARLAVIESYLLSLFGDAGRSGSSVAQAALHAIHESGGRVNMKQLSRSLGISDRHLRREFGRTLGLAPKKYAQMLRVEGVINRLYARNNEETLALVAQDFNYHDEPHMINDVKRHTLLSPGEMIATGALDWLKLYLM
ncbi:MAG: helix-turn-helix domain-containing protein [bacterium]|nr:helix-turn-helix domain-containing protein [bacterium]